MSEDESTTKRHIHPLWYAALCSGTFLGWLIFVGSFSAQELALGAGCSLFTGIFCTTMANRLGLLLPPSLRDIAEGWRLPGYLVVDTLKVLKVLAKNLVGVPPPAAFLAVPFEPPRDERSRTRSALAVAYSSATPNMIVLGIDHQQDRMLLHQLAKSNIPTMTRHLGAQGADKQP